MERVPIVEMDSSNAIDVLPSLMLAIKTSTFIALDLELSGLGNRKLLQTSNIQDRYRHICDVANSRSIVAFGISCFKLQHSSSQPVFLAQTFNITTMCLDSFIVEPTSLKFLLEHHFDFNRQFSQGLPYYRSNMEHEDLLKEAIERKKSKDKIPQNTTFKDSALTTILKHIITCNKPIVLHNAMVDLIFIYCSLYASPPDKLTQFMSDCHLMFPGGVYDTKVFAEYKHHLQASFLNYVFKKCQRENSRAQGKSEVSIEFVSYSEIVHHYLTFLNLSLLDDATLLANQSKILCFNYANHGWCADGVKCSKSHCIDLIVCGDDDDDDHSGDDDDDDGSDDDDDRGGGGDDDLKSLNTPLGGACCNHSDGFDHREDGKSNVCVGTSNINSINHNDDGINNDISDTKISSNGVINGSVNKDNDSSGDKSSGTHGAGIDAFMTAYVFACFITKGRKEGDEDGRGDDGEKGVGECNGSEDGEKSNGNTANGVINESATSSHNHAKENGHMRDKNEKSGVCVSEGDLYKDVRDLADQVYLCGKDITLRVVPSKFSKPSPTNLKLLAACHL